MSADQAVVKLRWHRGVYTSDLIDADEAAQRAEAIRTAVVDCRDGVAFVGFLASGGRLVHVRGREVVAVEVVPDTYVPPTRSGTHGALDYPKTGTGWLQQRSGHVPLDAPGGRS